MACQVGERPDRRIWCRVRRDGLLEEELAKLLIDVQGVAERLFGDGNIEVLTVMWEVVMTVSKIDSVLFNFIHVDSVAPSTEICHRIEPRCPETTSN